MIVDPVSYAGDSVLPPGGIDANDNPPDTYPQASTAPNVSGDAPSVEPPEPAPTDEMAPGLLRLLQAGHFKGVADVRLRINFHNQLSAAATAAARTAANQAVSDLSEAVVAKVDELASALDLSDEQLASLKELEDVFAATADSAAEAFQAADGLSAGEELTGDLHEAYDGLATSVGSLLIPDAPGDPPAAADAPAVAPPAVDSVQNLPPADAVEATTDVQSLITELSEVFQASLAAVDLALSTDSFLPELSPPSGNGVAYGKFLAQYQELVVPSAAVNVEA